MILPRKQHSTLQLTSLSAFNCGVCFGFQIQFIVVSPTLVQLGLSPFQTTLVWIFIPLISLLLSPLLGKLSDRSTSKYGKRKPFFVIGSLLSFFGFVLYSFPDLICGANPCRIVSVLLSLLLLNIGLNTTWSSGWCMLIEMCEMTDQQAEANSLVAFWSSVATLLASVLGSIDLSRLFNIRFAGVGPHAHIIGGLEDEAQAQMNLRSDLFANSRILFFIGNILFTISALPILYNSHTSYAPPSPSLTSEGTEPHQQRDLESMKPPHEKYYLDLLVEIVEEYKSIPHPVKWLCLAVFFSSMSLGPLTFFGTSYMATCVYKGDIHSARPEVIDKYVAGVRMGSVATGLTSIIGIILALFTSRVKDFSSGRTIWLCSQLIGSLCLLLPLIPDSNVITVVLIWQGLTGFLQAVLNSIPFTMLAEQLKLREQMQSEAGMYSGVFTVVQTSAQVAVNIVVGIVIAVFGSDAAGLAVGGVMGLMGILFISKLRM